MLNDVNANDTLEVSHMGEFMGIKIDNHVSVGHIFTTIAAVAAGIFAYANMQNDIKNLKETDVRLEHRIEEQKIAAFDQQERTDARYARLEDKIDKIYDVVVSNTRK